MTNDKPGRACLIGGPGPPILATRDSSSALPVFSNISSLVKGLVLEAKSILVMACEEPCMPAPASCLSEGLQGLECLLGSSPAKGRCQIVLHGASSGAPAQIYT